ncbi:MAG TPA: phenylalanine 4-monooxygenase, partial [Beijerinckiaceae bacterium]|nr:phenylalanine 4-monooxygenase [Beijerinckiaceae bacterium]
PLLMQKRYADYIAAYGRAGLEFAGTPHLHRLARLYWYTVEFGLMRTPAGLRILGAGLASSAGEEAFCLDSASPNRLRFDCERVLRTAYEIDAYQKTYFVLEGWEDLPRLDPAELRQHFARVDPLDDLTSADLLKTDEMVTRGDMTWVAGAD